MSPTRTGGAGGSIDVDKVPAGTGYSSAHGGVVEGERMLVGYIHKPRGTGSRMHSHPNEQFNLVVKGRLKGEVNGKAIARPTEPPRPGMSPMTKPTDIPISSDVKK